jgi:predicted PurR-regulated permease PerM
MPTKKNEAKTISQGILRAIATLAIIVLVLFVFYKITPVIVYVSISAVIALIFRPLIRFMRVRLKMKNTLAVLISMVVLVLIVGGLVSLLIPLVVKESENLSLLNSKEFKDKIEYVITEADTYLSARNINLMEKLQSLDMGTYLKQIPNLMNAILGTFGNVLIGFLSVLFISFFFMSDTTLLHNTMLAILPDDKEDRILKSLETIKNLLSRYFLGLILQISILFVIYTIVLLIFGIENAVVIALLAALLNLIPYVGPLIGGILMLFLTMTDNLSLDFQSEILPTTIYVLIGYVIAQLVDNFFSQPFIFSKSTKSHPLEIFLVILISGYLFGILGMVLAVPSYTAIKVILKEFFAEHEFVQHMTKGM